jgi:hypothetical protein
MDQKMVYFTRRKDILIHIADFMLLIKKQITPDGKSLVNYQIEDLKAH